LDKLYSLAVQIPRTLHFSIIVLDTHDDTTQRFFGKDFDIGRPSRGRRTTCGKGYSDADVRKILGGDTLRVMADAERVRSAPSAYAETSGSIR
jgi:hypothetical protein